MNLTTNPLISVVMPVHNALPFLDQSIRSILEQTLRDFEFVILDDASTDGSVELLREWSLRDKRINLHESKKRLGLSGSSNAVISKARAPIVARMDADDIAHPDRLRRQWNIIEGRPDVAVIGTLCNGIDASGRVVRPRDRWRLVRRSVYIPFPHGSAMFRREVFDQVGGYNEASAVGEDHSQNGDALAAFYMLGAMRLWAGDPPMLLGPMLKKKSLKWNLKTLMILASAIVGHISPSTLRVLLRWSIRARDLLASVRVKDGKPY